MLDVLKCPGSSRNPPTSFQAAGQLSNPWPQPLNAQPDSQRILILQQTQSTPSASQISTFIPKTVEEQFLDERAAKSQITIVQNTDTVLAE